MSEPAPFLDEEDPSPAALLATRPHLSLNPVDGLTMEEVPLATIAAALGTPCWVYSAGAIRARLARLKVALGDLAHVHYAVKANDHLAVLRLMTEGGAGADVVSEGELRKALKAGIPAAKIVFSGVGKTAREIRLALAEGIGQINIESAEELEAISALAAAMGRTAPVALRVNPDVDAGTHAKITTGTAENKFGIPYQDAAAVYRRAAELPGVEPVGLALHIGSQIMSTAPYRAAFARAADLVRTLRAEGFEVRRMDCGGGIGVGYRDQADASPVALAGAIRATFGNLGLELMVEPGRWLVAPAGVLLAEVVLVKADRFVVLDAAMNDLIRPALYESWHGIVPLRPGVEEGNFDVVGPVCESSDTFARARRLPRVAAGDHVALLEAGAYGAVMSSTYNGRPLAAIAMVDGARWSCIRDRQTHAEMWAGERVPDFLR